MGLTIGNFVTLPSVQHGANEKVRLHASGELSTTSAFSIFRGHARARENNATAQAFLNSIENDPVYSKYLHVAEDTLATLRKDGKPLTSRHISTVMAEIGENLSRDLGQAVERGKELAHAGVVPAGFGTSFGQFCMRHPLGNIGSNGPIPGELLRDFLKAEVVEQHVDRLCANLGMRDKAAAITAILDRAGLFTQGLDQAFAGHGQDAQNVRFDAVMHVLDDTVSGVLDVLQALHQDGINLDQVKDVPHLGPFVQTMAQGMNTGVFLREDLGAFFSTVGIERHDITTQSGQSEAVRSSQLNTLGSEVGSALMRKLELPENLGSPLAHHPDVQSAARTALDSQVPPPAIPTREQVRTALEGALRTFMTSKLPLVREFVAMAANPPVDLKPKALSPATLPQFINVLLEEDAMLDPLLGGDMPADFLQRVGRHSHVVESCTHGVRGSFGTDDFINVQRGAIQLLLARRGVDQSQYKDLLQSTINTFAPITSELSSVSLACSEGRLGGPGSNVQKSAMAAYLTLETHVQTMLALAPKDALKEMGVPGANFEQRAFHLLENVFQREVPLEEVSDPIRALIRDHGVHIDDMSEEVRARLNDTQLAQEQAQIDKEREKALHDTLGEFFPAGTGGNQEENPLMFYTAFDEASKTHDLTGLDPDKIKSTNMYKSALGACYQWMQEHPGPVDPAQLRTVIMDSIATSLAELKATLNSINELPEPRGTAIIQGAFTAQQKTVIKDMVMSTGLRDMELITRLAGLAREKSSDIRHMCRDQNTVNNLSEAIIDLAGAFLPMIRQMEANPVPNQEDALGGMMMMAIGFSGQDQGAVRAMFDSLDGELGQQVSGAFMHVANEGGMNQQRMLGAIRVMEELRAHSGTRLGVNVEHNPLFFTQTVSEKHQIPGQVMDNINRLARHAFSDLDISLGRIVPLLNASQLDVLHAIGDRLQVSVPQEQRFMIPMLLQGNARILLAAQEANGDRPLSASQIWRTVTGHSAPWGLKESALGGRLLGHVVSTYDRAVRTACPDMPDPLRENTVISAFNLGVSFPKLMALTRPGARLSREDVAQDLGMSSLRDYGPDNAFGLTTDFSRRGRNTVMRFEAADGRVLRTSPFHIPDAENVPTHPQFRQMLQHAESMTASPAQKARVMQAFSQAALIMPRVLSATFPGIEFSEHGNFSVTATQGEDNTVTVNITSDPALPLRFHQEYIIAPNGDHHCSEFVMERR
ncbi:hypothetical protein MASR1M90_08050 [Desulfovibrionales bacterium]